MMKNRECINIVVMHQKYERAKRSFRIYQVFKVIRREMIIEFHQKVPDKEMNMGLQKHVVMSFLQCNNPKGLASKNQQNRAAVIRNDQIFTLIRLCSGSTHLTQEECFLLMRKIHAMQMVEQRDMLTDEQQRKQKHGNNPNAVIQLNTFIKAIEQTINDSRIQLY